jgi:hypothetical protein
MTPTLPTDGVSGHAGVAHTSGLAVTGKAFGGEIVGGGEGDDQLVALPTGQAASAAQDPRGSAQADVLDEVDQPPVMLDQSGVHSLSPSRSRCRRCHRFPYGVPDPAGVSRVSRTRSYRSPGTRWRAKSSSRPTSATGQHRMSSPTGYASSTPTDRRRAAGAGHSPRSRKPPVGPSPTSRRTGQARPPHRRGHHPARPVRYQDRPGAPRDRHQLAQLPARPSRRLARRRFLPSRHNRPAPALRISS